MIKQPFLFIQKKIHISKSFENNIPLGKPGATVSPQMIAHKTPQHSTGASLKPLTLSML